MSTWDPDHPLQRSLSDLQYWREHAVRKLAEEEAKREFYRDQAEIEGLQRAIATYDRQIAHNLRAQEQLRQNPYGLVVLPDESYADSNGEPEPADNPDAKPIIATDALAEALARDEREAQKQRDQEVLAREIRARQELYEQRRLKNRLKRGGTKTAEMFRREVWDYVTGNAPLSGKPIGDGRSTNGRHPGDQRGGDPRPGA